MTFELNSLLTFTFLSFLLGVFIMYLIAKITQVNKQQHEDVKEILNATQNKLEHSLFVEKEAQNHILALKNDLLSLKTATDKTLQEKSEKISDYHAKLLQQETINDSLQDNLMVQKDEIEKIRKQSLLEFEQVANKLLEEKSERFAKTNQESINQILSPLKENLKEFKTKVEETYDKESKQRFSLEEKIKELVSLNNQISTDAKNLTNALKGEAKTQGNWGEMILENILEQSGLVKDREYFTQDSYRDENGKLKQPDVIIKYPNDRHIIVDSKVSLTAYERFANCENLEEQKLHLAQHIKSMKAHIDNLSSKEYDKIDKSLDFVMLFVPIEPAYMTAIHFDQELWSYAYQKRVLLISPTNLIAALKMVSDIWKREHQNTNALEIAKRGEKLYDKFVGFLNNMEDIGMHLERLQKSYQESVGKLSSGSGNLVSQAEKLKALGVPSKKEIPGKFLGK